MPKYYVVFTEESIRNHGFYVEAKSEEEAHTIAEEKYFAMEDADCLNISYSKTLNSEVQNA